MIGNIIKGSSFQKVVNYVSGKDKARFIGGNLAGDTPKTQSKEFDVVWDLNPSVERAVFHVSLSLTIGEHLSDEHWDRVASKYLEDMNFSENQYVAYIHQDKPHEHIHIIANRVRLDGSTVSDSFDYSRSEKVIRSLEQEYGLVPTVSSKDVLRKSQANGELRQLERTGEESLRQKLQDLIDQTTSDNQTYPEFIARLNEVGVKAKVTLTKDSKVKGISYEFSGMAFSGTQLGKGYTFPGLQRHKGIEYDSSMFKTTIEASEKTMIPTNTHSIREEVFDKAKKLLNRLALMKALKKSEEGQYYSGKRRTIVYSEKESRFSIYDSNSKEELLRVILGENPIYEKENLTQEDVTIFEEALRVLSEMTEQNAKQVPKHTDKDSLEIE